MSKSNWFTLFAILVLCGGVMLLAPAGFTAEEEERERAEPAEEGRPAPKDFERLERRLDEIAELIERAEQQGDEARIRELRGEGEKLLDQLEELERRRVDEGGFEEAEEWERHLRELEVHRQELELERLHMELEAARQESAVRMAHIASDEVTSASYAISQAIAHQHEEHAIRILSALKEDAKDERVKRIIRHHLARLHRHLDQPDAAHAELRDLILGQ